METYKKHIGELLWSDTVAIRKEIAGYEKVAQIVNNFAQKWPDFGLPQFTKDDLNKVLKCEFDDYVDVYLAKGEGQYRQAGITIPSLLNPILKSLRKEILDYLIPFYREFFNNSRGVDNLDIIDGLATVPDKLVEHINTKNSLIIRSEAGARVYEKYLQAQQLMDEACEIAATELTYHRHKVQPDLVFHLDRISGRLGVNKHIVTS